MVKTNESGVCLSYTSRVETFHSAINIFHFFTPFLINLISALVIIETTSRKRVNILRHRHGRRIAHDQVQTYRHLLVAPILLVIRALPRLIISSVSGRMKSSRDSWLYLIGYSMSFIPPILTFVLFILPSKAHTNEFRRSIRQYRNKLKTRIHPTS